jgi:hypothetical protein
LTIDDNLKKVFIEIEKTSEFHNLNCDISGVFYTLYARCKRLFYAISTLKNNQDKNVGHMEVLPLVRVFLEGYFHISYVMIEKDTAKVKEGYEKLAEWSAKRIAVKFQHSTHISKDGSEFVERFKSIPGLPKEFEFLDDMSKLSDKIGKKDLYRKHYSVLNSFIHFNPAVHINYGDFIDRKFTFNLENKKDEDAVYKLFYRLALLFIGEIVLFLENENLDNKVSILLKKDIEILKK